MSTELIATITPQYVDGPKVGKSGKAGPASLKTPNGDRFSFWTREIPLDTFRVGQTYQVAFTEEQNGAYLNRTIKRIVESQTRPVAQPTPVAGPKHTMADKSPEAREDIFVNGKLSAAISGGQVSFQEDALVDAINMLRRVFARAYKSVKIQNTENEFNDEIPFP